MRAVIQRVSSASVIIDDLINSKIESGLLIFLGIEHEDADEDMEWLIRKIISMRIFSDENGKMNLSVQDIAGDLLVVSQFTLHASTKKGNRPSFVRAADPKLAELKYNQFIETLGESFGKNIQTGQFGSMMEIELINDGPVTIIMDSKNKE